VHIPTHFPQPFSMFSAMPCGLRFDFAFALVFFFVYWLLFCCLHLAFGGLTCSCDASDDERPLLPYKYSSKSPDRQRVQRKGHGVMRLAWLVCTRQLVFRSMCSAFCLTTSDFFGIINSTMNVCSFLCVFIFVYIIFICPAVPFIAFLAVNHKQNLNHLLSHYHQ